LRQSSFDILLMLAFGVLGYALKKLDWPTVPLVIALILGPLIEKALRAGLELSDGDATVFLTTPISATLLTLAAAVLLWSLRTAWRPLSPALSSSTIAALSPPASAANKKEVQT